MVQNEEPCIRPADGNGSEPQQAAAPQGGLFPRFDGNNENIDESIRRFSMSRDTITRLGKTGSALVRSVQRDPLLTARVQRLKTVRELADHRPDVGVEMGDISRSGRSGRPSVMRLCGDEKRSAEKWCDPLLDNATAYPELLGGGGKAGTPIRSRFGLVYRKRKEDRNANRAPLLLRARWLHI